MSERVFWNFIKRGVGDMWDATRHTEALQPGVPDVSFGAGGVNGWIELKVVKRWPDKRQTITLGVRPEQASWLRRRGRAGGNCWVFVRFGPPGIGEGRRFVLYRWDAFTNWNAKYGPRALTERCERAWAKTIDWKEFLRMVTYDPFTEAHDNGGHNVC